MTRELDTKFIPLLRARLEEDKRNGRLYADAKLDDGTLSRFLRARSYNIEKSYIMIMEYFKWRQVKNVDAITLDSVKEEIIKEKMFRFGVDKEGYPTFVVFSARHESGNTSVDALEKAFIYILESEIKRLPQHIESFGLVLDLKGFSLKNMDRELEKRLITIFQNYFPERLHRAYIINAPQMFLIGWKVVQGLLAAETVAKIKFTKVEELPLYFNLDQLPKFYGGESESSFELWYKELHGVQELSTEDEVLLKRYGSFHYSPACAKKQSFFSKLGKKDKKSSTGSLKV